MSKIKCRINGLFNLNLSPHLKNKIYPITHLFIKFQNQ